MIVIDNNKFYRIQLIPSLFEGANPQGFLEHEVTPQLGDIMKHPSDSVGYVRGWKQTVNKALPIDLILSTERFGLDNDIYELVDNLN